MVRGERLDGPANGDTDDNAVRRPWLAVSRDAPRGPSWGIRFLQAARF